MLNWLPIRPCCNLSHDKHICERTSSDYDLNVLVQNFDPGVIRNVKCKLFCLGEEKRIQSLTFKYQFLEVL